MCLLPPPSPGPHPQVVDPDDEFWWATDPDDREGHDSEDSNAESHYANSYPDEEEGGRGGGGGSSDEGSGSSGEEEEEAWAYRAGRNNRAQGRWGCREADEVGVGVGGWE